MKLVLIRHGESQWNLENKFTGWTDVDLSESGVKEAIAGGKFLKEQGFNFGVCFTSVLKRAIKTSNYVLEELDQMGIPVFRSWRLNERHYGGLQGLNKKETADKYGDDQVHIWRRSFDISPPVLDDDDKRHPRFDEKYKDLDPKVLPATESLKDTIARVLPYWSDQIVPYVKNGKDVLIVAHGNSLRALVKYLMNISDDDIINLNLPTGKPLIYELDTNLKVISTTLDFKV